MIVIAGYLANTPLMLENTPLATKNISARTTKNNMLSTMVRQPYLIAPPMSNRSSSIAPSSVRAPFVRGSLLSLRYLVPF